MRDVTSGPIQSLFQHIYIALCFWSHFHHLEQQKLPVSVQSVEGLEPAVLCQRVRDLHDVVLNQELLSFNMKIMIFFRGCYVIVFFCSKFQKYEGGSAPV